MRRSSRSWQTLAILVIIMALCLAVFGGCTGPDNAEGPDAPGEKSAVDIGYVNWAECIAVSNLWKVILEEQGYAVTLTQLDVAPLFVGLSKGNIDVFMDGWLPITHAAYWEEYQDDLEDYGVWYQADAKIGIVVPSYVTIDSIAELKDQADQFGGQIIGIDPGAGIMKAATRANETYALGFEVVQGSEPAMMAALDKAYGKEQWIAITGWSPHWMFAKYDLKYLDDPEEEFGAAEALHTLANKNFAAEQPEVAAMLQKFQMTDDQIGSLEGLINDGMDPADAAAQWIADNQDVVDGWLK